MALAGEAEAGHPAGSSASESHQAALALYDIQIFHCLKRRSIPGINQIVAPTH
jgi:hypothetical protein